MLLLASSTGLNRNSASTNHGGARWLIPVTSRQLRQFYSVRGGSMPT